MITCTGDKCEELKSFKTLQKVLFGCVIKFPINLYVKFLNDSNKHFKCERYFSSLESQICSRLLLNV